MKDMKSNRPGQWFFISVMAVIFVGLFLKMFAFQVRYDEYALVLRFGKPVVDRNTTPGLHFKWPHEKIWRMDNRIQCFEGNAGVIEEVFTKDEKNITVTIYVCWKIANEHRLHFLESITNLESARDGLTALLRSYKSSIIGKYNFRDLINLDPKQVKIKQIEDEIFENMNVDALKLYGVEIMEIGITHIGFPESVSKKVLARMKAERQTEIQKILSKGDLIAAKIKVEAEKESAKLLAEAENEAKRIRALGDAEAAEHYAVFQENPKLALFLRKLDSLRKTLSEKTTLILDTNTMPFDLLKKDALDLWSDDERETK